MVTIDGNLQAITRGGRVLDLSPEGGDKGGEVVAQGAPEQVAEEPPSYTGQDLKPLLQVARAETVAAKPKRKRKAAVQGA